MPPYPPSERGTGVGLAKRLACLAAFVAALVSKTPFCDAQPRSLATKALEAADALKPVTQGDVRSARLRLAEQAIALEQTLRPGSERGEAWKAFLEWRGVQKQLPLSAELDLRALQTTFDRLTSGQPGLERAEFRAVSHDLQRLLGLGLLARLEDQDAYLRKQGQLLSEGLARDPAAGDPGVGWQIERRLAQLAPANGAATLNSEVRGELAKPNLHAVLSQRVLGLLARRPVADTRPLRDTILGTSITGTGNTTGLVSLSLLPSRGSARLAFGLSGAIDSRTVGANGPVLIRTKGDTRFHANKIVELTDESFRVLPADIDAKTSSRTQSINKSGGRFGKKIVEAIAAKKVDEARGQANAIASRKAERQVAGEFDQQVVDEVRFARKRYDDLVRKPLRRRGAQPKRVDFSTTSNQLTTTALLATPRQLGAAGPPPAPPGGDVSLRLHQSALSNVADAFLGGATIRRRGADQPTEIDAVLPQRLREALAKQPAADNDATGEKNDKPFRPWSITLRRERPVSFVFADGTVTALVHTARIESGEAAYRGWDLILTYRLVMDAGRWYAELVGEFDVLPTSFDPGAPRARLASRQRALRRNLAKQLTARALEDPDFPRRPELRPIDLARLNKPGLDWLAIRTVDSNDGWLTLSFDAL